VFAIKLMKAILNAFNTNKIPKEDNKIKILFLGFRFGVDIVKIKSK
jgi:hypothetical protein